MTTRRTVTRARVDARATARELAIRLGRAARSGRERRRWSQAHVAGLVGLSQSAISRLERGLGAGYPFEDWLAIARVLDLPLRIEFGRDRLEEPSDAGHLGMQEFMLRLGRETGRARTFELPTKPAEPGLSVDVFFRDDAIRTLFINECWNTFGSINASVRSTHRKIAQAEQLAVALGGTQGPYAVRACWIVRDTRRNREIVARYPEIFASTFPGSSRDWVTALATPGTPPPQEPGLVWLANDFSRLVPWRKT